jgi:hypothetical protein
MKFSFFFSLKYSVFFLLTVMLAGCVDVEEYRSDAESNMEAL